MGILTKQQEHSLVKRIDESNQALLKSQTLLQLTQLGNNQATLQLIDTAVAELGEVIDDNKAVVSQIMRTLS